MLYWRLPLGTLIVAVFAGLCWLDHLAWLPGTWLMPLVGVITILASAEIVRLMTAAGARPRAWIVYCGNLLILASGWMPVVMAKFDLWQWPSESRLSWQQSLACLAWPFGALTICTLVIFIDEMRTFEKSGRAIINMASSFFALIYVGLLMSFLVQLRLVCGVGALVSLIIVVKFGDTGAYFTGRSIGRHKMSPVISPGKTIEGAAGAIVFACLGAWLTFFPSMLEDSTFWTWLLYGVAVAIAGIFGDLAESLIKRDAGCKDSSAWMPGFGGVLDMLDSLLFAAPVGWIFWILF
jgi:phosphatidate cytidylyltransferase